VTSWLGRALGVAILAIAALPAMAGPRPTDIFFRYHAAINAAQLCEGWQLEPKGYADPEWGRIAADRHRMDRVIAEKTPGELSSTERLRIILSAKDVAARVVAESGCDAPRVRGWLSVFHSDLETVLAR